METSTRDTVSSLSKLNTLDYSLGVLFLIIICSPVIFSFLTQLTFRPPQGVRARGDHPPQTSIFQMELSQLPLQFIEKILLLSQSVRKKDGISLKCHVILLYFVGDKAVYCYVVESLNYEVKLIYV